MRTNTHITWYKKSIVNREESYTRYTIRDCFWEERKAANVIASGIQEADSLRLFIPYTSGEYAIKPGDILVKNIVSDAINSEFTITDLKKKYDSVLIVRSVDDKNFGSYSMRHLEISAS